MQIQQYQIRAGKLGVEVKSVNERHYLVAIGYYAEFTFHRVLP
jgi:hypothetical protein